METLQQITPSEADLEHSEAESQPFARSLYLIDLSLNGFPVNSMRAIGAGIDRSVESDIKDKISDYHLRHRLVRVQPGEDIDRLRRMVFYYQSDEAIEIPEDINTEDWANLKDYYHPNGSSLTTCAREFKDIHPRYGDGVHARGLCGPASREFMRLLTKRGIVNRDMEKSGEARTHTYFYKSDGHTDFRIGRISIDWTARQFDADAPFPLVRRLSDEDLAREAEVNELMRRRGIEGGTSFENPHEY